MRQESVGERRDVTCRPLAGIQTGVGCGMCANRLATFVPQIMCIFNTLSSLCKTLKLTS